MTWVRRAEPPAPKTVRHQCTLPNLHDAEVGDLWRCDTCRDLWRVASYTTKYNRRRTLHHEWRPARWWQRLRYRDRARVAS